MSGTTIRHELALEYKYLRGIPIFSWYTGFVDSCTYRLLRLIAPALPPARRQARLGQSRASITRPAGIPWLARNALAFVKDKDY